MEASKRVGEIEALQKQVQALNVQANNQTSYWQKLSKMCENLSSDQQEYLNRSDDVKKAKSQMVEAFNLFLFENFKEQFATQQTFQIYCDRYVDSIKDALEDYANNMSKLREENEKLRKQLQEQNKISKGGYCED